MACDGNISVVQQDAQALLQNGHSTGYGCVVHQRGLDVHQDGKSQKQTTKYTEVIILISIPHGINTSWHTGEVRLLHLDVLGWGTIDIHDYFTVGDKNRRT